MISWIKRKKINTRINAFMGILAFLVGSLILLTLWVMENYEVARQLNKHSLSAVIEMLEARRAEKNILLRKDLIY